jgi:hypothetical protein
LGLNGVDKGSMHPFEHCNDLFTQKKLYVQDTLKYIQCM